MSKISIAVFACLVATNVLAQDGSRKMTRDELLSFLPGAKVTHISQAGSERRWTNKTDGTLIANSNNKLYGNAIGTQGATQAGTWMVNDEGKYCIDIDWKRVHEKWCANIIKSQDGAYYLNVVDDKHKIDFVTK
ncbi:MAG: hypothetical protein H6R13_2180 [Proteobacteria bacterium]|nr:hypothetical protein [Pseudomonadota bacterium]